MSRLRYCLPVIGAEFVRFGDDDSRSGIMQSLQLIQNEMLRIVSGKRRRDHERIADMLENARMLSINQLASYSVLIESWRAETFNIEHLSSLLTHNRRDGRTLRSDTTNNVSSSINEPYAICARLLWNRSTTKYKETKSITVAKREAKSTAKLLPL